MRPTHRLLTAAVLATAVGGSLTAAPALAGTGTSTGTPAPPAGYRQSLIDQLDALHGRLARLQNQLPSVARLRPAKAVAAAAEEVRGMSDSQLTALYAATGSTSLAPVSNTFGSLDKTLASSGSGATAQRSALSPALVTAPNCGTGPDARALQTARDAIASAQIVLDAAPQSLTEGAIVAGEGAVTTFPDPARVALQAALSSGEVAVDELQFESDQVDSCETAAHQSLLRDVANDLQSGIEKILGNVAALSDLVDKRTTTIIDNQGALTDLVDKRTTTIINQNNLDLKLTIQQALVEHGNSQIATLELPASAGGYLDARPIGVQEVVTDTLAEMKQAGERVSPPASKELDEADSALAAKDYKTAYALYQKAYQAMVK